MSNDAVITTWCRVRRGKTWVVITHVLVACSLDVSGGADSSASRSENNGHAQGSETIAPEAAEPGPTLPSDPPPSPDDEAESPPDPANPGEDPVVGEEPEEPQPDAGSDEEADDQDAGVDEEPGNSGPGGGDGDGPGNGQGPGDGDGDGDGLIDDLLD